VEMSKKIFITGCAKSGTTLLLRMCYAFKNTEVLYREGFDGLEITLDNFISYKPQEKFTIGKRHPPVILSCAVGPWPGIDSQELDRQYNIIKQQEIGIINIVRDGRDVILSDNNFVKPQRWIDSIKQKDIYSDIINVEVFYEDLVTEPLVIQRKIESVFGIQSNASFEDYPEYVPDCVYDWNIITISSVVKGNEAGYGKRRLSTEGILRFPQAYKDICNTQERGEFESSLKKMKYGL